MTELLLSDTRAHLQDIVAWAICLAALVWGAGPERAVALVWLVLFELVSNAYRSITGADIRVDDIDPFSAMIDACAVICWVAIALYANRNYTLWIAAMQLLAVTAHLARGLVEAIAPLGYIIMVAVPGWVQLFLLGAGLTRHILRKRQHGQYRDWRRRKPQIGVGVNGLALQNELALQNDLALKSDFTWQQAQKPSWRDDLK